MREAIAFIFGELRRNKWVNITAAAGAFGVSPALLELAICEEIDMERFGWVSWRVTAQGERIVSRA